MIAPSPHGAVRRYNNGCRCAECTIAKRLEMRRYRRKDKVSLSADEVYERFEPEHGTRSCYNNRKCRRTECVQANRDYVNERNRRRREDDAQWAAMAGGQS